MHHITTHNSTIQQITTQHSTIHHITTHNSTIQQITTQHITIHHITTHNSTIQQITTQHSTIHHITTHNNTIHHIKTQQVQYTTLQHNKYNTPHYNTSTIHHITTHKSTTQRDTTQCIVFNSKSSKSLSLKMITVSFETSGAVPLSRTQRRHASQFRQVSELPDTVHAAYRRQVFVASVCP